MRDEGFRSPTPGLAAALVATVAAVSFYAAFTIQQIHRVQQIQQEIVETQRRDSLQLLRIQDNLNSLGLLIRDMIDQTEPYPIKAWMPQFERIRLDLADSLKRGGAKRDPADAAYLQTSMDQFWTAVDQAFAGDVKAARLLFRNSLESRRAALSNLISRQLVRNNESEQQAIEQISTIYNQVERNIYIFLGVMLATLLVIGLWVILYTRRLFRHISLLSDQRRELSRRLISGQEDTFRHVSRELHDQFGQILTAIGVMLQRAARNETLAGETLLEVREITQASLDSVRSLSQSLQPVILEEQGLIAAVEWYLPMLERQTGLVIHYEGPGEALSIDAEKPIHIFRVLQEALNNVIRHSAAKEAFVRLTTGDGKVTLEVEDHGTGIRKREGRGIGLTGMRERASLIQGVFEIHSEAGKGTKLRLTAPLGKGETV